MRERRRQKSRRETWIRVGKGEGGCGEVAWCVAKAVRCTCVALNDDTKILTETDTETFFPIPNFPKPIPRL